MLEIKNLHARVGGKEILKGIDLAVGTGEVHAVMGPNGSGKSTLAGVLAGRSEDQVTAGSVTYNGRNLLGSRLPRNAPAKASSSPFSIRWKSPASTMPTSSRPR